MKWSAVFVVALVAIFSSPPSALFAQKADRAAKVEIQSISHALLPSAKESITVKLSGPAAPKVFTMKNGSPRLVMDFPSSSYKGKGVVPLPGGKLATAIRVGMHQKPAQKVRVVVDLSGDGAVQHTLGQYIEADRTITVTLAAGPPEQQQKSAKTAPDAGRVAARSAARALPGPQKPVASPPEEKPVPPAPRAKEVGEEPPVREQGGASPPQLLDITFDDDPHKGEMVLFHLNDFYPPTVSAVEKDTPQVVCDFLETGLGNKVREDISVSGKYVRRIRTARHTSPDKIQVVLELAPERDYDLQQVFFKNDNLFVLIVNELAAGNTGDGQTFDKKGD